MNPKALILNARLAFAIPALAAFLAPTASAQAFLPPIPILAQVGPGDDHSPQQGRGPHGDERSRLTGTGEANVRSAPFLARGDGKADDTHAIQAALDAVGAIGGGAVRLPTGTYLVKTHLVVPAGTSLVGVGRAPQLYSDKEPGSTLLAVEGAGQPEGAAFITLQGPDSTLEGIKVLYPNQVVADEPIPYPWTVRGGGDDISLINVLLVNPYQAVDLATRGGSRHYIRGLYGQPLFKGIWVDKCTDIGRVHDVHFWPFWSQDKKIIDFTSAKGTAFIFQRADWEVVENIFCWDYRVGIELSASKDGATNGQMTDVDLDAVDIGIDAQSTQQPGVSFSNLAIANDSRGRDRIAVWGRTAHEAAAQFRQLNGLEYTEPNTAVLFIRGGSFWGQLNRVVKWESPGTISLSDSRLVPWVLNGPMIEVLAGQAIIHDNSLALYPGVVKTAAPGTAIVIGPQVESVSVHDNLLNGNTIENEAGTHATIFNNRP
jgi:hypothetical protein